jgi:3-phenylpropionate/trans-cinnamate dioxygenase ferredoxin reductase subunit
MRAEVAIVGNGVAGYACAARLAKHGIRPLLIGRGLPVDRPPLSKAALADGEPRLLATAEKLVERGIDVLDAMVDDADVASRRLVAGGEEVEADAVVLATGLSYRPPPIPGLELAHVNATPGGMRRLAAALAGGPRTVAVIGGGLIGVETAATLAGQGHAVTVLDLLPRPFDRLHDPLPAIAEATLAGLGIPFVGDASVEQIVSEEDGQVTSCHKRGSLTTDVVVAALGGRVIAPPGLADGASAAKPLDGGPGGSLEGGVEGGPGGSLEGGVNGGPGGSLEGGVEGGPGGSLDGLLEVGADMAVPGLNGVYAAGDLVLVPHARFGSIRFPHWDAAIGTGEQAADAIAGVARPYERLPYWWSDLGPRRLAEVGWAGAVDVWVDEDGIHVGRDAGGVAVAALVVDEPRRLREARALVLGDA